MTHLVRSICIAGAVAASGGCTFELHDIVADGGAPDGGTAPVDARNLTTNPSFEDDTLAWAHVDSVISSEAVADAPNGLHAAHVVVSGTPAFFGIRSDTGNVTKLSVAGARYCVSARVRSASAPPNPNAQVGIHVFDDTTKVEIGTSGKVALSTTFQRIFGAGTATVTGNQISVHISEYDFLPGDAFEVDLFQLVVLETGGPACP